jgi:hypothetical protein
VQARSRHIRLLAGLAAALVLLVAAPAASAHRGSPAAVASNYEARLSGFKPAVSGLKATVTGGDIDLTLAVPPGRQVVVLGVEGEPMLRFSGGHVYGNERSPSAASARIITLTSGSLRGPPIWKKVRNASSFRWHESRLRPAPGRRNGPVAPISIPLRIDGTRVTITGTSWYAAPPTPLLWLAVLAAVLITVVLTLRSRDRLPTRLVLPVAVVAVASVLAIVVGTTLYAPHSTLAAALEIGAASLLGGAALIALAVLRPPHRAFVTTVTGGLCVLFTATSLPVLTHGFALTRLPADLARLTIAVAITTAVWLVVMGGLELFTLSSRSDRPSAPRRTSAARNG